jgi:hypothetical protein
MPCQHCQDDLPDDTPPAVQTCRQYADWYARTEGDMLTQERAGALMLFREMCGLAEALEEGREVTRADV